MLFFVSAGHSQPEDDGQQHPAVDEAQPSAEGDDGACRHNPSKRLERHLVSRPISILTICGRKAHLPPVTRLAPPLGLAQRPRW